MWSSILTLVVLTLDVPTPRWGLAIALPGTGIMRIQRNPPDNPLNLDLHNGPVDPGYNLLGIGLERILQSGWTVGGDASVWISKGGLDIHAGLRGGIRRVIPLASRWELALDAGAGPAYASQSYNLFKAGSFGGQHTLMAAGRIGSEIDWLFRNGWVAGIRPRVDGAVALARFGDAIYSDGDQGNYMANKAFLLSACLDLVVGF